MWWFLVFCFKTEALAIPWCSARRRELWVVKNICTPTSFSPNSDYLHTRHRISDYLPIRSYCALSVHRRLPTFTPCSWWALSRSYLNKKNHRVTLHTNRNADIFQHLQKPGKPSGLKKNVLLGPSVSNFFCKSVLWCGPSFPFSNTLPVLVFMPNTKLFDDSFHSELARSYPLNLGL